MYRLQPPHRTREPNRPMQVLCLGLSRSGTDSLRKALQILGYNHVYHGFVITGEQRADAVFWTPLIRQKAADNEVDKVDYDSVLGNMEAVTDAPAAILGKELMEYYPNAKVILNRRKDVDAWKRSMKAAIMPALGPSMWLMSWFDARLFQLWKLFHACHVGYYSYDFDRNGKRVFEQHYANMEAHLRADGRPWLDWSVEDGWEPLCAFLQKDVPDCPFPHGNKVGEEFESKMKDATKDMAMNAIRNMAFSISALLAIAIGTLYRP